MNPAFQDRRHDSGRASARRRAAEDALLDALLLPNEVRPDEVGSEGQTLLSRAVARLSRQEGVLGATAWALDADGEPRVLAASPGSIATRLEPSRARYAELGRLGEASRLTEGDLSPDLRKMAESGVNAVAPIAGLASTPSAILLVFGEKPGRIIRPRVMAILAELAKRLEHSLSTRTALDRLGRLDEAVQRLDRLAALGGLVSEIVHEIRNPLVSVKTFLQLLPERLDDPEFHQDFRGVVEDEVARLERLLDDLLRHARPAPANEMGSGARIHEAAETTRQLLAYRCRERGIELDVAIDASLPALGLSEDALRQLLLNLLLNASQATPSGGSMRLSASWSPLSANHVEIAVEDDGPGIDPALAKQLFEPFWTTRSEGAGGLGLAICKRIVEEAEGTIEIESRSEGGACFRIELPISR